MGRSLPTGIPTAAMSSNEVVESSRLTPTPIPKVARTHMGSAIAVRANCGMCVHYKNIAYPRYKDVCSAIGILPENMPCKHFAGDYRQLQIADDDRFAAFAYMVSGLRPKARQLLASIILRSALTERNGYKFGEHVRVRVFENDYLSNYRGAVVVAADATYVYLEGARGFHAMVKHENVMNLRQWLRKKQELEASGRLIDPMARRYLTTPTNLQERVQDIIDRDRLTLIEEQTRNELQIIESAETLRPPRRTGPGKGRRKMSLVELFGGQPETVDEEVGKVRVRRGGNPD